MKLSTLYIRNIIALSTYVIFYHSKMLKFRYKFRDNFSIVTTSKRRLFEELFLNDNALQLSLGPASPFDGNWPRIDGL